MRTTALVILAGALLVGCPKEEEAQSKSQGEESPAPSQTEASKATQEEGRAPERYTVELDTTKGAIVVDVHRDWAPNGADRFYELVQNGYFSDVAFFRVVSGFMAQGGISGDPSLNAVWREKRIPDDPVKASNLRGTVTFATSGPDSRTTQFFINFGDNHFLNGQYTVYGRVVSGMEHVDAITRGEPPANPDQMISVKVAADA